MKNHLISQEKIVKKDQYRFINLGLFSLVALSNSFPLQAFTGVSFIISQIYKQSILTVSINWITYIILYLAMILPANFIIDQKGLKYATLISQTCMIVGLTFRCLINISFTYFLLGTCLCSFGFCLTLSSANKLPSVWFPENQVFATKSLLCIALLLSDGFGYLISTLFITKQSSKTDVLRFLIIQSIILIIFQLLNIIFFKDKPFHPANYFSQKSVKNFQQNTKRMVSNPTYWWLFFSLTFIFIGFSVLFVGLSRFQKSFETTQKLVNLRMLIVCFSGIFAWYLSTLWCKNQYKIKCSVLLFANFVSYCFIWLGFETKQDWLISVSMAGIGFSVFPLISTITDWAAQSTFPVGEGTSGGSLFFGGYTFGSISTLLFGIYIGHDDRIERSRITIIIFLVFIILSFLFMILADSQLKRKDYEQKKIIQKKLALINIQTSEAF